MEARGHRCSSNQSPREHDFFVFDFLPFFSTSFCLTMWSTPVVRRNEMECQQDSVSKVRRQIRDAGWCFAVH